MKIGMTSEHIKIHTETMVKGFFDEYDFLSNFYPSPVVYEDMIYTSAEAAYQAAKTEDSFLRSQFQSISARESKKLGRRIAIRRDWEKIKLKVMEDVLRDKFTRNEKLKKKLLETGEKFLEETNWWGDKFWGVCEGRGKNHLGLLLMQIRNELK